MPKSSPSTSLPMRPDTIVRRPDTIVRFTRNHPSVCEPHSGVARSWADSRTRARDRGGGTPSTAGISMECLRDHDREAFQYSAFGDLVTKIGKLVRHSDVRGLAAATD